MVGVLCDVVAACLYGARSSWYSSTGRPSSRAHGDRQPLEQRHVVHLRRAHGQPGLPIMALIYIESLHLA
ncbi:hypothetical protein GQ600_18733 [Phytophthora cactorum]|nr:hypothetical protein GQ600_18733 [Phytophthora cactorum]